MKPALSARGPKGKTQSLAQPAKKSTREFGQAISHVSTHKNLQSDPFLQTHWYDSKKAKQPERPVRKPIDPKPSIVVCHEVIQETQNSNGPLSKFLTSTNPKLVAKSPLAQEIYSKDCERHVPTEPTFKPTINRKS